MQVGSKLTNNGLEEEDEDNKDLWEKDPELTSLMNNPPLRGERLSAFTKRPNTKARAIARAHNRIRNNSRLTTASDEVTSEVDLDAFPKARKIPSGARRPEAEQAFVQLPVLLDPQALQDQ
jgi:hypothetical protein